MKRKQLASFLLSLLLAASLVSCGGNGRAGETTAEKSGSESQSGESSKPGEESGKSDAAEKNASSNEKDYAALLEKARGSELSFYGWGGDERLNNWLDGYFSDRLKEKYDIRLKRVGMDIETILSQLSGEVGSGKKDGSIDMIWINGENFKTAKEGKLLYGPFAEELPNFKSYIDSDDRETSYDFGFPIEGYEAPYGKAQLILYNDSAVTPETPKNTEELLAFAKKYKGKVSYPALPDFTGSAFVRNIIYDICGYEQFQNMPEDKETVQKAVEPAMEYLRSLNPYLWNEGKSFPDKEPTMKNMFADGELVMGMSYGAFSVATNIEDGSFPESTRSFQFEKGTIGNTNYIAIAVNSQHKEAAEVAINEMMSPEVQAERYKTLRTIPVVDYQKLNAEEKQLFDSVDVGKGVLSQEELLSKRLPEMPAGLVPIIEEIWAEEVPGK